jgi:murein DD-endopeptidase MepM/ murein hydrolase activator NlpD
VIIGQIAKDASFYNGGIRDAKGIALNVKRVKKNLVAMQGILEGAQKKGYRPDKKITASLETAGKDEVKPDQVFQAKQNTLNPDLSGQVLSFYSGVTELQSMLADHLDKAKADDLALSQAAQAAEAGALTEKENAVLAQATKYRYAVVLANDEKSGTFGAQIVELGPPFCGDGKQSNSGACSDAISGFGYRTAPSEGWIKADVAKPQPGQPVPPKQIIPIVPGGIVASLIAKPEPSAAEVMYQRRMAALAAKVDDLIKLANTVETKLNAKGNEGERFSFFL